MIFWLSVGLVGASSVPVLAVRVTRKVFPSAALTRIVVAKVRATAASITAPVKVPPALGMICPNAAASCADDPFARLVILWLLLLQSAAVGWKPASWSRLYELPSAPFVPLDPAGPVGPTT